MHHPTDWIIHSTAVVTSVVEHWLEREIAQWVHPMKDRSDDPSHHEQMILPRSYISLLKQMEMDKLHPTLTVTTRRAEIYQQVLISLEINSDSTHHLLSFSWNQTMRTPSSTSSSMTCESITAGHENTNTMSSLPGHLLLLLT